MPARAIAGDLAVFSIATVEQKTLYRDGSITVDLAEVESSPVVTTYERADAGKKSAVVRANLMSAVTGSTKVIGLDVSAYSIGGTNHLGNLESGSMSVEWQLEEGGGISDAWAYPVCVKKRIRGEAVLRVPATGGSQLPLLFNGALSALDVDLTVTINGVTITFPVLFKSLEHSIPTAGVQKYSVSFSGKSTDANVCIAAPVGTTSQLEKALNTTAAQAFVLTSKASGGTTYSGSMILQSYNVRWAENDLVLAETSFASQGAVTIAATV